MKSASRPKSDIGKLTPGVRAATLWIAAVAAGSMLCAASASAKPTAKQLAACLKICSTQMSECKKNASKPGMQSVKECVQENKACKSSCAKTGEPNP
jgi:hypothetical protein